MVLTEVPVLIPGKAAIQVVLRGSKTVDKRGALKMFEKSGDYESAVQDFYSVRPTNVKRVRLSNGVSASLISLKLNFLLLFVF